jgi:hypothetical protein
MALSTTKQYLPMFQPSEQVTSDLVPARKSLIFPSSSELILHQQSNGLGILASSKSRRMIRFESYLEMGIVVLSKLVING